MNISPSDISDTAAKIITTTEGGMIAPKDPPAVIVPEISALS